MPEHLSKTELEVNFPKFLQDYLKIQRDLPHIDKIYRINLRFASMSRFHLRTIGCICLQENKRAVLKKQKYPPLVISNKVQLFQELPASILKKTNKN